MVKPGSSAMCIADIRKLSRISAIKFIVRYTQCDVQNSKSSDSNAVSTAELKSPKIMKLLMSESSIEADILPMHSINIA